MGRGRAKAKQTKVARELKYSSPHTDFKSLQRELHGESPTVTATGGSARESDEVYEDRWAAYDEDEWRRA